MRIYTRAGDDGTTGLLGPGRVFKDAARVEACGSVDELNALLGVVRTLDLDGWLAAELTTIQSRLFHVGAELAAVTPDLLATLERISDEDVAALERWIDRLDTELAPLTSFVLPGGSALGAELHVARAACRRAERRIVTLLQVELIDVRLVRYLNRLGDLLFVMARWCNRRAGAPEAEWHPRRA
jgi:cob(I)alamin adenosyltransferase